MIISNKHGISEFRHESSNDLTKLENILPHGIFAAGVAYVPTQEKQKNKKNKQTRKHLEKKKSQNFIEL